ncbi:MAG: hemin uptake protein HemP [Dechloromonas sp.]|nr:hemin uptake protein HemP [Dechloromonas sp.]
MNVQHPLAPERKPALEKTEARPRIDSEKILGGSTAVEIEHAGQRYLLRVTRENKLILTK